MNTFIPSIDLILGPMYSGKSTELIRRLTLLHDLGLKVLYVNSQLDDRSQTSFSTHNKTIGTLPFDNLKTTDLERLDIDEYDVIGIDEAQFFGGLVKVVLQWVEKHNKIVLATGLNGDYKREKFGEILELIPYCDTITKLNSYCMNCRKNKHELKVALFTQRVTNSKETILIGGKEAYQPVCRNCYTDKE